MINTSKLPIIVAIITILTIGGVAYLKITPGPGKQLTVAKPGGTQEQVAAQKEESLTPAEKAVKKQFESYLINSDTIHQNIKVKEVENDGYEAVVIASADIRQKDKEWRTEYEAITAKLVGNSWSSESSEYLGHMILAEPLRAWRDVKVLGLKDMKLTPPSTNCRPTSRGEKPDDEDTTAELMLEVENKSDMEHIITVGVGGASAKNPVQRTYPYKCDDEVGFLSGTQKLKIDPNSTKTYSLKGYKSGLKNCCVYQETVIGSDGQDFFLTDIDGYQKPTDKWWLEHPQYIP